jgi:hypothetical protein
MATLNEWGRTLNLIVNGNAELSADNFPAYGWETDRSNGGRNVPFGAYRRIVRGNKTNSPHGGAYFFAPVQTDANVLKDMISKIPGAPHFDINKLPGLIPGGFTPGNMPGGHKPGSIPPGMPTIPGLPFMPELPGMKVPSFPKIPGVIGLPGIPILPGMSGFNSSGLPHIPGITEVMNLISTLIKEIEENLAAHVDLSQTVDISIFQNWIATGEQTFNFGGWYSADDGQDKAEIFVTVLDSGGSVIKSFGSGQTNKMSWQNYSFNNQKLPPNAKKIKITLRVSKSFGHKYYAGCFDDLVLTMPIYKIPFTISANTVEVGSKVKITPSISMSGITYTSLNPDIASVDSNGNVTGLKVGRVNIRVTDNVFKEVDNIATITVTGTVPAITTQPTNVNVNEGQSAIFIVSASGNPAPTYQWETPQGSKWTNIYDVPPYSDTTSRRLTISNATMDLNNKEYRCVVRNATGIGYSNSARLTVQPKKVAPAITVQPSNVSLNTGQSAIFKVAATGDATLTYQWQFSTNGTTWTNMINIAPYSSVNTNQLNIANLIMELNGYRFRCVVTNSSGTVTSNAAILTVTQTQTPPSQQGTSIFKMDNTVSCNGIYGNTSPFSANLNNLNRNHFKISAGFLVNEYRNHWALVLSNGWRVLGIKLNDNGKITITTNNQENEYNTNISYQLNTWNQITVEHSNGSIRVNNGNWFNVSLNTTAGDNTLSSQNFSNGIAFKGDLRNIEVVSYN